MHKITNSKFMDREVLKYIEKLSSPQKEILQEVRKIILATLPDGKEEAKWGALTYSGGKFYLAALRDSVNIGFAITGLSKKDVDLFQGKGKTMRHIKIKNIKDIDARKLIKIIKLVNKKSACKPC